MEHSLGRLWQSFLGSWGTPPPAPSRRDEHRLPAHGLALIRRDIEEAETEAVNLLGMSANGFSFRSQQSLPPEQKIVVEVDGQQLEAVVRHSTPDGDEFVIGAEILYRRPDPSLAEEQTEPAESVVAEDPS